MVSQTLRLGVNVLEERLREEFDGEPEARYRRMPYFTLARRFLSIARRYPEPKRSAKLDDALDYARASGLDPKLVARIRRFVLEFWEDWRKEAGR
jgi:hypothetical protein